MHIFTKCTEICAMTENKVYNKVISIYKLFKSRTKHSLGNFFQLCPFIILILAGRATVYQDLYRTNGAIAARAADTAHCNVALAAHLLTPPLRPRTPTGRTLTTEANIIYEIYFIIQKYELV